MGNRAWVSFITWCDRVIQWTATCSLRGGYDAIAAAFAEGQGILIGQKKGTGAPLTGVQQAGSVSGLLAFEPPMGLVKI